MKTLEELATKYGWSEEIRAQQKALRAASGRIRKQVKDLQPGDVLAFTKQRVVSSPVSLCRTPKGKVELTLERPNGGWETKTWNARTEVVVADQFKFRIGQEVWQFICDDYDTVTITARKTADNGNFYTTDRRTQWEHEDFLKA